MGFIIGIHMGHDASVSVLEGGKPIFCVAEERLSREKMHWGFPFRALETALRRQGRGAGRIDRIAFDTLNLPRLSGPEKMALRFSRGVTRECARQINKAKRLLACLRGARIHHDALAREKEAKNVFLEHIRRIGLPPERIRIYDHHLCHAASAFWPSPFQQGIYVTSDARGDGKSATLGAAAGWKLEPKHSISDLDSIGQFYAAVTAFLEFQPNRHEGKVMGLAAHGDPLRLGPEFLRNVRWNGNGAYNFRLGPRYRLDSEADLSGFMKRARLSLKEKVILQTGEMDSLLYHGNWFGQMLYLQDVASDAAPADVAAGAQWLAETVSREFIRRNMPPGPAPVVLAGGLFSNVRVNQRIRELENVSSVFVQPAMGDDGLSLGAALLAYAETAPAGSVSRSGSRPSHIGHTYLGPSYSRPEILEACQGEKVRATQIKNVAGKVAEFIHQGLVVGYFRGEAEYGPRALGHRSILAKTDEKQINQKLNARLQRTEFMPFAPSMLAEEAASYLTDFDSQNADTEFMTSTYGVHAERRKRIAAAVHVDGTVRPQVVRRDKEPEFHNVLRQYFTLSGLPAIINTSFNLHEEPMVCTPQDAIRSFKRGCVDVLVMEDVMVQRPPR